MTLAMHVGAPPLYDAGADFACLPASFARPVARGRARRRPRRRRAPTHRQATHLAAGQNPLLKRPGVRLYHGKVSEREKSLTVLLVFPHRGPHLTDDDVNVVFSTSCRITA